MCGVEVVGFACGEVVVDVFYVVVVDHLLDEIVDVELRSAIHYLVDLRQQLVEVDAFCGGNVVERYLVVNALDDFHLLH